MIKDNNKVRKNPLLTSGVKFRLDCWCKSSFSGRRLQRIISPPPAAAPGNKHSIPGRHDSWRIRPGLVGSRPVDGQMDVQTDGQRDWRTSASPHPENNVCQTDSERTLVQNIWRQLFVFWIIADRTDPSSLSPTDISGCLFSDGFLRSPFTAHTGPMSASNATLAVSMSVDVRAKCMS